MRFTSILLILAALSAPASANWFTETMASGFTYLKESLFGEDFEMVEGHKFHKELVGKFISLKADGLSLTFNLLYYNLATNMHRACLISSFFSDECALFSTHVEHFILTKFVVDGDEGYRYPLIEEFFTDIFKEESIDPDLDEDTRKKLVELLPDLKTHFEGPTFAAHKDRMTERYNALFKKLMDYLYSQGNVAPRALGSERPESGRDLDPSQFRY